MDPLRKAVGEALIADKELEGLLSAPGEIHHDKAPVDAKYPYVVFREQSPSLPLWAMAPEPALEESLWLVKGVGRGLDADQAEDINLRCQEVLNDAPLKIEGKTLLFCLGEAGMPPYSEEDTGEAIFHRGTLYRIKVQP